MSEETEARLRRRVKGEGGITMQHLQESERRLRDELSSLHAGDKAERDAINVQLTEIAQHIKDQKEAQSKEDEVKETKTTMVVPPNDVPPAQPNVDGGTEPVEKRKGWKSGWHGYLEVW